MSATLTCDPSHVWTLRIQGVLARDELDRAEAQVSPAMDAGEKIRGLIVLDGFEGWKHGDAWEDTLFFQKHGDDFTKIAITGDPKWETEVLLFLGAGIRRTPVRYFSSDQETDAWAWLME